jgi:hypothetical protein
MITWVLVGRLWKGQLLRVAIMNGETGGRCCVKDVGFVTLWGNIVGQKGLERGIVEMDRMTKNEVARMGGGAGAGEESLWRLLAQYTTCPEIV